MPPKIVEEKSTISPEPIREGDTLVLYCHTEGIPKPKVSWYFRKRHHSHSNSATLNSDRSVAQQQQQQNGKQSASLPSPHHEQVLQEGDTLIIKNVSRYYSGVFECIANNSVPPAASRKIKVSVECKKTKLIHLNIIDKIYEFQQMSCFCFVVWFWNFTKFLIF